MSARYAAATEALTEAAALIAQFQQENIGAASVAALTGVTDATRAVQLAAAGAEQIVIANLPNIGATPAAGAGGWG